ncbi:hypothetical protein [Arcticibacterium luteifluviistationis]|uniref:DUF1508 domain-containing protein n=1 Tax=Arcticibacterium luteifluviistationis TaxID=1784714 RepID=A0A2Z4G9K6_9BACT|nr:hypothetical protein [Arcticibacterium luteifluviistationis]AWV97765.1 hypothetical protein DJ013_06120 [Arcticibacterium luteifluviistationis]
MENLNDYLPCEGYLQNIEEVDTNGFIRFTDESSSLHYFAIVEKPTKVLFRSEAYKEIKSRENGIKSVLKNFKIEKRYKIIEDGINYFLIIKAGNHQEIARSCPFGSILEAEALKSKLFPQGIAKSTPPLAQTKPQSFLEDKEYLGRIRIKDENGDNTGYVKFNPPNGLFYYAVYNDDDSLYLKSLSYETIEARDKAFGEMLSEIADANAFEVKKEGLTYFTILKGKDGAILGKSAPFHSFIDAFKTTPKGYPIQITDGIF